MSALNVVFLSITLVCKESNVAWQLELVEFTDIASWPALLFSELNSEVDYIKKQ